DLHGLELADASVADELGRVAELGRGTLLAADLEDPSAAVDGVAQHPPLGDGQRGRLLEVDVLAGLHGVDRDPHVPVVGGADHHRVDVLVREQLPVVGVPGDAVVGLAGLLRVRVVHQGLGVFRAPAVEVAHGHDPGRVELPDPRHVVAAGDAAGADRAHAYTAAQ